MGKFIVVQNLIWAMIVLGQVYGCRSCTEGERKGLLEIKAFLKSINEWPQYYGDGISSWTNDTRSSLQTHDCCLWQRIKCDGDSRRVIGLSLYASVYSDRKPFMNLSLLYPFQELQELNLSGNSLGGWFDNVQGYKSFARLKKLQMLDLSSNELHNSILPFLNVATSLKTLILSYNLLNGPFPIKELKHLESLEVLDLSGNNFNGSLTTQEMVHLNKLKVLGLSGNGLTGSLESQGICDLKNLRELDLSNNDFLGQVPPCFGSLKKLRLLDLSSNQFSGKLPSIIGSLESLEYLSLSNNSFEGLFSFNSLANLTKLKVFMLSSKPSCLHGLQEETSSSWQPNFQLSALALQYCNLERIPDFLRYQKELQVVDLSNNRLSGNFPAWLLENNTRLDVMFLQNNSFTSFQLPKLMHNLRVLDVSANDFDDFLPENIGQVLPSLIHMDLSKNSFQRNLPSSLGKMKSISFLDLSHNHFSGQLPTSFIMGCYSLQILRLSYNNFSGQIFPRSTNLTSLLVLHMDNNEFSGKLGDGFLNLSHLMVLDISNNSLTDAIPRWMGNFTSLVMLSMPNNFLEGTIPNSLFDAFDLRVLDLSGNMLSGTLPSPCNSSYMTRLYLQDNDLTGPIPDTLLGILDLRNNKLSGSIPPFVSSQMIIILLLRGNNLSGHIPRELCSLSNIQLLDLAYNRLDGSIPSCLNNMSFGSEGNIEPSGYDFKFVANAASADYGTYYGSMLPKYQYDPEVDYTVLEAKIEFATKQRYDSYTRGTLDFMFGLDLSSNELSGEVPTELGDSQKLRALNLSHNDLSGFIPESFSKLKDMESLDLSCNRLHGPIPHQVSRLDSLVVFNVSYNNLSGPIPQEGHASTLAESNYIGNPLLCGPPTNRSCDANNSSEMPNHGEKYDETAVDMDIFLWSCVSTYVTVLMGVFLFLCFDSPWRRAWFHLVDAFICSLKTILS